jgi:FMN-dependent NADH-azoreductase
MAVANAFVEAYRENNPNDEIATLDIFKRDLVPFDGLAVQAKYTILHGQKHSQKRRRHTSRQTGLVSLGRASEGSVHPTE